MENEKDHDNHHFLKAHNCYLSMVTKFSDFSVTFIEILQTESTQKNKVLYILKQVTCILIYQAQTI